VNSVSYKAIQWIQFYKFTLTHLDTQKIQKLLYVLNSIFNIKNEKTELNYYIEIWFEMKMQS